MFADQINSLIYEYCLELEFNKLSTLLDSFSGEWNTSLKESIITGRKIFIDFDGELDLINNPEESDYQREINYIFTRFKNKYKDLLSSIIAYSNGLQYFTQPEERNFDDVKKYLNYITSTSYKLEDLELEYNTFQRLIESYNPLDKDQLLNDVLLNIEEEEKSDLKYYNDFCDSLQNEVSEEPQILNFEPIYAANMLHINKNFTALQFMQLTCSNGLHYLPEHKSTQEKEYNKRNGKIISDDIVNSVWNSGWLAPDGSFYGCPDLLHIDFSDHLYKYLQSKNPEIEDLTSEGTTSCRKIELLHYIKLSEGRWFLPDKDYIPSKRQLEEIIRCQSEKYKTTKIYYHDEFMCLDVIEAKLNNKEIYSD